MPAAEVEALALRGALPAGGPANLVLRIGDAVVRRLVEEDQLAGLRHRGDGGPQEALRAAGNGGGGRDGGGGWLEHLELVGVGNRGDLKEEDLELSVSGKCSVFPSFFS